jgi:hypothetical protein
MTGFDYFLMGAIGFMLGWMSHAIVSWRMVSMDEDYKREMEEYRARIARHQRVDESIGSIEHRIKELEDAES